MLIPDPSADVAEAVSAMKKSQEQLRADVPAANNPAKRTRVNWWGVG